MLDSLEDAAGDHLTKAWNEKHFEAIKLKQHGMANMSFYKGTSITILGNKLTTPLGIGPIPYQKRYHYDGEIATAQAAKQLGVVYTLDIRSSYAVADIVKQGALIMVKLCPLMDDKERSEAI